MSYFTLGMGIKGDQTGAMTVQTTESDYDSMVLIFSDKSAEPDCQHRSRSAFIGGNHGVSWCPKLQDLTNGCPV